MTVIDLLNIEGLIFFKKENNNFVYINRKAKKNYEELRNFHNIVQIKKNEIIIIHSAEERKKIIDYFTDKLKYKKD